MFFTTKTGLVFKVLFILLLLLGAVIYKLNDHFGREKLLAVQGQLRQKTVFLKTSVASQIVQLRNVLSSYESDLSETNINWVQLDPFFAVARAEVKNKNLKVQQMLGRSNTPAERWNLAFIEKALKLNQASSNKSVLAQMFQDKSGAKYLVLRFKTSAQKEVIVVSGADYFQKFFDLERGGGHTSLLATDTGLLVAHSEADYVASISDEIGYSIKKYVLEKEEIVGTNLTAMNYKLRSKIGSGFSVPWSIVGLVLGGGFILIGILFYALDPIERKVERYKKQEREQIYKETLGQMMQPTSAGLDNPFKSLNSSSNLKPNTDRPLFPAPSQFNSVKNKEEGEATMMNTIETSKQMSTETTSETKPRPEVKAEKLNPVSDAELEIAQALSQEVAPVLAEEADQFLMLDENKMDIQDIEKALALDDFDSATSESFQAAEMLEKNLTPQKISVSDRGGVIDKPEFSLKRKDFKVDEVKVHVRRPERS